MTTTELIDMLRELEDEAGGPVRVQVMARQDGNRNQRFDLDYFNVTLDDTGSGQTVLLDVS